MGIFFEFADFKRYMDETHEYKRVPNTIIPSLKWFAQALICMGIYQVVSAYMDCGTVLDEKKF